MCLVSKLCFSVFISIYLLILTSCLISLAAGMRSVGVGIPSNGRHLTGDGHNLGYRDPVELVVTNTSNAVSQVEHQTSVKVEQQYDHALYSTMMLYHGC